MTKTDQLGSMFDTSPTPVCVSIHQKYIYVNRPFSELTGYDPDELIGRPITMVTTSESRELQLSRNILREKCDRISGF